MDLIIHFSFSNNIIIKCKLLHKEDFIENINSKQIAVRTDTGQIQIIKTFQCILRFIRSTFHLGDRNKIQRDTQVIYLSLNIESMNSKRLSLKDMD